MIINLSEKKGNIILITDIYQTKDCIVFEIKFALFSKYKKKKNEQNYKKNFKNNFSIYETKRKKIFKT